MRAHFIIRGMPLFVRRLCPILLLFPILAAAPVYAQPYANELEGHRLAATWCAGCHQVEVRPLSTASDAIPSFRAVAEMPSTTTLSLHAFLRTSHPVMPDLKLTEPQIDDLAAYIVSLRPRPAQ